MSYTLNFTIPQGPIGPMGPQGPKGDKGENGTTGLNAYGGKYNASGERINLGISTRAQVPLISNMPNYNLSYASNNGIEINQTGTYEISYVLVFTVTYNANLSFSVRQNNSDILALSVSKNVVTNENYTFFGSTIMDLTENDVISLALVADPSTNVILEKGSGASLIIKKVN